MDRALTATVKKTAARRALGPVFKLLTFFSLLGTS